MPKTLTFLPSLTIFFPFYNDEGTVLQAVQLAHEVGKQVTNDLEVIAIHGGASKDNTWQMIQDAKKRFPHLVIIDKTDNTEGYAVIKHGFLSATKDWVFYTDGDLQYDVHELLRLVEAQKQTEATVVNGYKVGRGEGGVRQILGQLYAWWARLFFSLPIRDTDCDFRLIKTSLLKSFNLSVGNASVLPELLVKLKRTGAIFAEVPVSHSDRRYGKSNYSVYNLLIEKLSGDVKLWWAIKTRNY